MNYQLLLSGFQAVDIKKEDRLSYYENLEAYAVQGDLQPFAEMIAGLEEQRLDEWLALAQEQAHSPQMTLYRESPCPLLRRGLSCFWKGAAHGQDHNPGVSGEEAGGPCAFFEKARPSVSPAGEPALCKPTPCPLPCANIS